MGKRRLSVGQLVLLGCVVVALVFGVTYFSIYLGSGKVADAGGKITERPVLLAFSQTKWPLDPEKPENTDYDAVVEAGTPGHHVFGFESKSTNPVRVWLDDKNCKCTSVEVGTFPEGQKAPPGAPDGYADKLDWHVLPKDDTKGVTIPGNTDGAVRLTWSGEKQGKQQLRAVLGTEAGMNYSDPITLRLALDLVPPMQVNAEDDLKDAPANNEIMLDTLTAGDTRTVNLLCWSQTRSDFPLKVELPDNDPCVQLGKVHKLSKEESAELGKRDKKDVRCAYRVPVTVVERTESGTQFELGRFRRYVKFVSGERGIEPITFTLLGIVRGDVTVGTPDDRDMVMLGSFEREDGKTRSIPVTTPDPRIDLEKEGIAVGPTIVKEPEYLKAELKLEDAQGQLGRVWTLTVTVPPNTLSGPLPPHTAVVLRTRGEHPRRIRVPVTGNAYVR